MQSESSGTETMPENIMSACIPDRLYFRIGDVSRIAGVKPYVLRYWESEFAMISPQKSGSGQRVYRRSDVETVLMIKHLLYEERYSIEGARKRLKELRKEGELKSFKQETIETVTEEFEQGTLRHVRGERLVEMKKLSEDLKNLMETPISDFFKPASLEI
ncbi:MAG: MerR family transcriptional regulator [Bdellovibrionota bacterium]